MLDAFDLNRLPPSALDVLRYFGGNGNRAADDLDIMDGAALSERSFSKAIKRLVTLGFAAMNPQRQYQLTNKGLQLLTQLGAQDANPASRRAAAPEPVYRHLAVVVPQPLVASEPSQVFIGFEGGERLNGPVDVVLRLSAVHGEVTGARELAFTLRDGAAQQSFSLTPAAYSQVRLRVQAYQLGPNPDDISEAGGLYVDIPVTASQDADGELAAYGVDVMLTPS